MFIYQKHLGFYPSSLHSGEAIHPFCCLFNAHEQVMKTSPGMNCLPQTKRSLRVKDGDKQLTLNHQGGHASAGCQGHSRMIAMLVNECSVNVCKEVCLSSSYKKNGFHCSSTGESHTSCSGNKQTTAVHSQMQHIKLLFVQVIKHRLNYHIPVQGLLDELKTSLV